MEVKVVAKNIRISPEKLRLVVDSVRKLPPTRATEVLDFVTKKGSVILKKVINSAIANAKNNHGLDEQSLTFKEIQVGKGVMFKRYRAGSRGRSRSILKRTSHVRVVLVGEQKNAKGMSKEAKEEGIDNKDQKSQVVAKIKDEK